jgi:hypothetical protein
MKIHSFMQEEPVVDQSSMGTLPMHKKAPA